MELARSCWSRALAIDPLNAYVCHALCNLECRLGNTKKAKEILVEVVNQRPTSALCVALAEIERQTGAFNKARETLLKGLKSCAEERSKLLLALAWLEEDAFNNVLEAESLLDESMRIDGNNVRVHIAKASFELRLRRVDKAREILRNATSLKAEDGQHYTMWCTLELECGDVEKARSVIEEGYKKYPADHFLLQRWGTFESRHGNQSKARELFEKSVLIQPHAPTFVAWAIMEETEGSVVTF